MSRLRNIILAGIITGGSVGFTACSRSVDTKTLPRATPSITQTGVDISQTKNLSLEVEFWSCEDARQVEERKRFLFREAFENLKSRFPKWNIPDYAARPSEKEDRHALEISIECCGVDEEGTPGFCLDVRIWSPDGNHWNKYSAVSRAIKGDDFGKVITAINEFVANLPQEDYSTDKPE